MTTAVLNAMSRDVAVKVISTCGRFRLSAVHALGVYRETLKRHNLTASSREDGRLLSLVSDNIVFSNLLASQLNQEERVMSTFVTPEATCYAESLALGECRAYVAKHSQSGVVHGALRVDRVLYNHAKPVSSVTVLDEEESRNNSPALSASTEDWSALLQSNLTPHVFNFYSKSEGVPVAVLLASSCSPVTPSGDRSTANWTTAEYSAGAVLQSIVDGSAESSLRNMQQHLLGLLLPSTSSPSALLEQLQKRSMEKKCVVQDLLGLFSGDYSGAYEVAKRCRLPAVSVTESAQVIEPLRMRLGVDVPVLSLDVESATRTPLDYFCRCSKADFVNALRLCTQAQVDEARAAGVPVCRYCKRSFDLNNEEWQAARAVARST